MAGAPRSAVSASDTICWGCCDMTKKRRIPDLEEWFQAADAHAADAGDLDHTVGALQEILRATWRVLTPAQRRALFAETDYFREAVLPSWVYGLTVARTT